MLYLTWVQGPGLSTEQSKFALFCVTVLSCVHAGLQLKKLGMEQVCKLNFSIGNKLVCYCKTSIASQIACYCTGLITCKNKFMVYLLRIICYNINRIKNIIYIKTVQHKTSKKINSLLIENKML